VSGLIATTIRTSATFGSGLSGAWATVRRTNSQRVSASTPTLSLATVVGFSGRSSRCWMVRVSSSQCSPTSAGSNVTRAIAWRNRRSAGRIRRRGRAAPAEPSAESSAAPSGRPSCSGRGRPVSRAGGRAAGCAIPLRAVLL